MGLLLFFVLPLAWASFTAKTQELAGPHDGKIDQVLVTFSVGILPATAFASDFEVAGYQISSVSATSPNVTLTLVPGDVPDSGATPLVKFFPGRLMDASSAIISAGQKVLSVIATDGCPPVWDLTLYTNLLAAPIMDSGYVARVTYPGAELFASFSEKVNLTNAGRFNLSALGGCPNNTLWTPVDGPMSAASCVRAPITCSALETIGSLQVLPSFVANWSYGVTDLAGQVLQPKINRTTMFFVNDENSYTAGLGFAFNDTTMNTLITTETFCNRGANVPFDCVGQTPLQPPLVVASSWDMDGNGKIDTIQVLTKQWNLQMVRAFSIMNTSMTLMAEPVPRETGDTLASSTQSLWSLSGYTITAMREEHGRVLLSVAEIDENTTAITAPLIYNGVLMSWTKNALNAASVVVADKVCPVITAVTGMGGSTMVNVYFSEDVAPVTASMFMGLRGSNYVPFVNGALTGPNVFVGNLASELNPGDFSAPLEMSGLGISQLNGGPCPTHRNYVSLAKSDTILPNISNVYTKDSSNNGKIDAVVVKFSERIYDPSVLVGSFSFSNYTLTLVSSTANDDTVEFSLNEWGGIDTSSTPTLVVNAGGATDMSGNALLTQGKQSSDGVGPYYVSAKTGASFTSSSVTVDKIVITFSEPVFNVSLLNFSVPNPADITLVGIATSGATVTLDFTALTPVSPDMGMIVSYVQGILQDGSGNLAPNQLITVTDGVAPLCGVNGPKYPITEDLNKDGHIDRITLSCTEAVTVAGSGSYVVGNYTVISVNASTTSCPDTFAICLFIYVQQKPYYDTGVVPSVTYTGSPAVTDIVGNSLANFSFIVTDKTPPVLLRILTQDTNGDGKIDLFQLDFSEKMLSASGLGSYWTINGYTAPTFNTSGGQSSLFLFSSASNGSFDGGATPDVAVVAGGARDLQSNFLPAYLSFNSTDGVFPIVLNAFTAGNCKLGLIQISMNENINLSSVNTSSFSVPGYNITGAVLGGVLPFGFSLQVASYPLLTPDAITPSVSYNAPLSIVDKGGNAMVAFTKTAIDSLAPCMVQCSGHVGGSYVGVVFSEPVSTGALNVPLDKTNFRFDNSSVGPSSVAMNTTSVYQITLNASFVESDINFLSGDTFASIAPILIHDTNGMNATTSCYVFNDDITPPRLISAMTVNRDNDTMIDGIMLTFDDQVKDSTFDAAHWTVSNYNITGFSTGTTANDSVLYLELAIKSIPDTGATPNVTYTKPAFGGASDRNRNFLNTTSMIAVDGAVPMLVSFSATILSVARGGNNAIATFSEPVSSSNGSATALTSSNLIYKSMNGGASTIQTFLDADASDGIASMKLDTLVLSDFHNDSVVVTVWDNANLSSTNRSVFVTKGDVTPPALASVRTGDSNQDGMIDHLIVTFDDSMLDTSLALSTFALASYSLSNLVANDTMVILDASGPAMLDGDATPEFTYTPGIAADLNGNFLQALNVNASDGVKPFLLDCSSTLPNLSTIECQFSEAVIAINSDFALGGPLGGATVTGPTVAASGQVITIQLSRALVLSDFKMNSTVDLAINTTLVDEANNPGIRRVVTLRNTDVYPPNVTNVFTRDTDCNGVIDAIELIFNEGVIDTNVAVADFSIGGSFMFTGAVRTGAAVDDNRVMLVVQESATPNTDVGGFSLTYTPGRLTDLSENKALAFTMTVVDGAGVALVSVIGTVDQALVNLTFSGPITQPNNSQFELLNFSSPISLLVDDDGTDSKVAFTLTSTLLPQDFILPARINPLVIGPDGNIACNIVALTNPDKTLPTVVSIATLDDNGDGYLDGFLFTCSKPIYEASLKATDFSVANYTVTGINISTSPTRTLFKLFVAQKNGTIDASMTPQVSYTKGSLTDRYGNALASFSNMPSKDGAGPAIVSAVGLGSSLTITFSKPVFNSTNGTAFKLADVVYHATGNGSTANALSQIIDKNGADATLTFTMSHEFTAAEFTADTISGVSASIFDAHGNQANSVPVKIQRGTDVSAPAEVGPLTETEIILIGAVGGGGLLLLIVAVVLVVFLKKKGSCFKKKEVAFDQNQIANEFDFGSAGSTEMTQSSKGAQRLEA